MNAAVTDEAVLPLIQASQLVRTPSRTPGYLYDQPWQNKNSQTLFPPSSSKAKQSWKQFKPNETGWTVKITLMILMR